MAIEGAFNVSTETALLLVSEIGKIGIWLQTLGLFIVIWIVFQVFNLVLNRKRLKDLESISTDIKKVDRKISRLGKLNFLKRKNPVKTKKKSGTRRKKK